jgi:hypothetical protein
LALPVSTYSIAETTWMHHVLDTLPADVAERDVIFVSSPDCYLLRLSDFQRRVAGQPVPRRMRSLAIGSEGVVVGRPNPQTLRLDYAGGILASPRMQLYRDGRLRMAAGDRIELDGLSIEVRQVTPDGRPSRVDFTFHRPLDGKNFLFYTWTGNRFVPFTPPPLGETRAL